jgi:hypothetical protein
MTAAAQEDSVYIFAATNRLQVRPTAACDSTPGSIPDACVPSNGCRQHPSPLTNQPLSPLPQDCDAALVRRFDRRIQVPLPDDPGRRAFLEALLQRPELQADVSGEQLGLLVERTSGYSGADLAVLCRWAARLGEARLWLCHPRALVAGWHWLRQRHYD